MALYYRNTFFFLLAAATCVQFICGLLAVPEQRSPRSTISRYVWTIQVHYYALTFDEANQICQKQSLSLLHIRSPSDKHAVEQLRGRWISDSGTYWLGMNRSSTNHSWEWLVDHSNVFDANAVLELPKSNFLCGALTTKWLQATSYSCGLNQTMHFMCSGAVVKPACQPVRTVQVNDYKVPFSQARKVCQDQGLHLLHIHPKRNADVIRSFIGVKITNLTDYWIGVHRWSTAGDWKWIDDDTPLLFGNESQSISGISYLKDQDFQNTNLSCGKLHTPDFTIAAEECERNLFFICMQ